MIGDGKTQYDHDHDNESHELAGCSVGITRSGENPLAKLLGTIPT
jgi:hypothetical protein